MSVGTWVNQSASIGTRVNQSASIGTQVPLLPTPNTIPLSCLCVLQLTSCLPATASVLQLTRSAYQLWAMQHHDSGVSGLEYLSSPANVP